MKEKQKTKTSKGKMAVRIILVVAVLLLIQWLFIGWRFNFGPFQALGRVRLAHMPGNAETYDFSHLQSLQNSPLTGKTVCFLGSSVTNGAAALNQSVPEYFTARMGCSTVKEAVDGTTLVDSGQTSYIQRMLNNVSPQEKIDLLVCQLSTNDASKEKPLGQVAAGTALENFDTQTVTGAMEYLICYAKQTWDCPVVFYTNARFDSDAYAAMVGRLRDLQEKWGIGVLDLWSGEAFNAITAEERALYMKDAIHPTKAGYRDWGGPELERQLCEYLAQE